MAAVSIIVGATATVEARLEYDNVTFLTSAILTTNPDALPATVTALKPNGQTLGPFDIPVTAAGAYTRRAIPALAMDTTTAPGKPLPPAGYSLTLEVASVQSVTKGAA